MRRFILAEQRGELLGWKPTDFVKVVDLAQPEDFPVTGYGWDWDDARPKGSVRVGGAPELGTGAFYSDVQGSQLGGPRNYSALRLYPRAIFGDEDTTLADLRRISYWTRQEDGQLPRAWQLKIYTVNASYVDGDIMDLRASAPGHHVGAVVLVTAAKGEIRARVAFRRNSPK